MEADRADNPTIALVQMLEEIATSLSMRWERNPDALTNPVSRATEVSKVTSTQSKAVQVSSPEEQTAGVFVDFYAVLISDLPTETSSTRVTIEDLQSKLVLQQRRAAIALTWLPSSMRSDLNLFIVAPAGSSDSTEWSDFAAQAERNEHVCRKLVWLPPADSKQWKVSARNFCERTFLARPWIAQNQPSGSAQLDPLAGILQGEGRMAKGLSLMENEDEEDSDLAESLMNAFDAAEAGGQDVP